MSTFAKAFSSVKTTENKSVDKSTSDSGCAVGAFVNGAENLSAFQTMAGKKLAVVLFYVHWPSFALRASEGETDPFPTQEANTVDANGSVPLITWEPWLAGGLEAIASGSYEGYVREFLKAAKDWGKPILLRFAHEMNGNWYPWGGEPDAYKRAWLYIYNVRQELKADNVKLVWCPNNTNQPDVSWNTVSAYYPGDEYVDWVGMDGYNWGYGGWQSFDSVFSTIYKALTSLTGKPLMIGEFGSAEQGGSKADWLTDAFAKIKSSYPGIKLFCWFNINKERDWRVNSSLSSEAAFRNALHDSRFFDKIY